jgi:hypothetical protein
MFHLLRVVVLAFVASLASGFAVAQDPEPTAPATPAPSADDTKKDDPLNVDEIGDKVEEVARKVDEDERAKEAAAGVLKPIYQVAEYLSFPAIHWVAFALMITGVVSFALQLVLAKLVVLMRFGFSLTEILADALGLAISIVGLVLTTQAAAENSSFTRSPFAVLSAAIVGLVVGFIFYWWGQRHEIQAVEGRRVEAMKQPSPKK